MGIPIPEKTIFILKQVPVGFCPFSIYYPRLLWNDLRQWEKIYVVVFSLPETIPMAEYKTAVFVRGIHQSPVNSKGQWRGALMFSLICAWIHGWVNNREAGDLRCHHAHYDVTVMFSASAMELLLSCTKPSIPTWHEQIDCKWTQMRMQILGTNNMGC